MYGLGWLYQDLKKDYETAAQWYEKAAAAGYAKAMKKHGDLYFLAYLRRDRELGLTWYHRAAAAGDPEAISFLYPSRPGPPARDLPQEERQRQRDDMFFRQGLLRGGR
jgi:Sel1 repeat